MSDGRGLVRLPRKINAKHGPVIIHRRPTNEIAVKSIIRARHLHVILLLSMQFMAYLSA